MLLKDGSDLVLLKDGSGLVLLKDSSDLMQTNIATVHG